MQSSQLLDSLISAHREMQAHTGGNKDDSLISTISDILCKLPPDISSEKSNTSVFQLHENVQTGLSELSPLSDFLKGEIQCYNTLLTFIQVSLTQLLEVRSAQRRMDHTREQALIKQLKSHRDSSLENVGLQEQE